MAVFFKDPEAVLDFNFDWSDWLTGGEAISNRTIEISSDDESPPTLTKDNDQESGGIVTVWLSSGTALVAYKVECKIVTDAGRTDERTMVVRVKER